MDIQFLLTQSRQLISEAETGKALAMLEDFTEAHQQFKSLQNDILQISAIFTKTGRDEQAGIISFDNARLCFNQVNHQLLSLLENLENERFPKNGTSEWVAAASPMLSAPDLTGVSYDHALRPEFTENVVRALFRRRQSVNLIGENGGGSRRLLEDIQACDLPGVCIAEVDMKNYVVSYEGFLQDIASQLCPENTSDHLNELASSAAESQQQFVLLLFYNFDALLNDPVGLHPRYDVEFLNQLNALRNTPRTRLLCVTRQPHNQSVFKGHSSWLNLELMHLPDLTDRQIAADLARQPDLYLDDSMRAYLVEQIETEPLAYRLLERVIYRLNGVEVTRDALKMMVKEINKNLK